MAFRKPHKDPKIVFVISGKKGAGKDLLGSYLKYYGFVKVAFADTLKRLTRQLFKLTIEQTDGAFKEKPTKYFRGVNPVTPRQIMIEVGQFFRSFKPDWWVDQALEVILNKDSGSRIYVPDARFPNEIRKLKGLSEVVTVTIRLERDNKDREGVYPGCSKEADISETALDDYGKFDYVLPAEQNHTPQDLEKFAAKVVDDVTKVMADY